MYYLLIFCLIRNTTTDGQATVTEICSVFDLKTPYGSFTYRSKTSG